MPDSILMLVPHDPDLDPRIAWVASLCTPIAHTDITGLVFNKDKPAHETKDNAHLHRAYIFDHLPGLFRAGLRLYKRRTAVPPQAAPTAPASIAPPQSNPIKEQAGKLYRFVRWLGSHVVYNMALRRCVQAPEPVPLLVICHDMQTLAAGVALRRRYGCRLIYDSHEYWPEADIRANRLQRKTASFFERRLVRHADTVVTVTPQIARALERLYGLARVVVAPNAAPVIEDIAPPAARAPEEPVRFLYQGRMAPGRGLEALLSAWAQVEEPGAVLVLRAPDDAYYARLRARFAELLKTARVEIAPPVDEGQLISAASRADVGIIPYVGPSLNHHYACPNKLSQYMQAGLAVLSTTDLVYVSEVIARYECGLTYDPAHPASFVKAARRLVREPGLRHKLQQHAYHAARTSFNWAAQSAEYAGLVRRILDT